MDIEVITANTGGMETEEATISKVCPFCGALRGLWKKGLWKKIAQEQRQLLITLARYFANAN